MSAKDKIEALAEEHRALLKRMRDVGTDGIREAYAELFAEFPSASAVRWSQYTPYFNDGDTCEFSVREIGVKFDDGDCGGDYDDGFLSKWDVGYAFQDGQISAEVAGEQTKACQAFVRLHRSIPEELHRAVFDDHVEVTIHRDGKVDVDEYSHD